MSSETKPVRVRLFHPERLFGELVAVRVHRMMQHPTRYTEYGLIVDWATEQAAACGEFVKHGGLVNQMADWRSAGVVVGIMGQSGAGLQTPWALHPVPESQRARVVALLRSDPVNEWPIGAPRL